MEKVLKKQLKLRTKFCHFPKQDCFLVALCNPAKKADKHHWTQSNEKPRVAELKLLICYRNFLYMYQCSMEPALYLKSRQSDCTEKERLTFLRESAAGIASSPGCWGISFGLIHREQRTLLWLGLKLSLHSLMTGVSSCSPCVCSCMGDWEKLNLKNEALCRISVFLKFSWEYWI